MPFRSRVIHKGLEAFERSSENGRLFLAEAVRFIACS
jgi:hypothetical protein